MRILPPPPKKPLPRFEFSQEDLKGLVDELHSLSIGREYRHLTRTPPIPKLDEFAYLAESLLIE